MGSSCKGICDGFKVHMIKFGEKKYLNNYRCTHCNKWFPKEEVFIVGINNRCPCCHMKVRTKRFTSKGTRGI